MGAPLIVLDPGHGTGNKKLGEFDQGCIGVGGTREADWTLLYAGQLREALEKRGCQVSLTRQDNNQECSLQSRVAHATRMRAGLLLSIHFNADAMPGVSAPDGKIKGFEILYGTPGSLRWAQLIVGAASAIMPTRMNYIITATGQFRVLRYDPSVIMEIGFLDDPEDFKVISDQGFIRRFCTDIAFTVAENLKQAERSTAT